MTQSRGFAGGRTWKTKARMGNCGFVPRGPLPRAQILLGLFSRIIKTVVTLCIKVPSSPLNSRGSSNPSEKGCYIHPDWASGGLGTGGDEAVRGSVTCAPQSHNCCPGRTRALLRGLLCVQESRMVSGEEGPTVGEGGKWMTHRYYRERWTRWGDKRGGRDRWGWY